MQKITNFLTVYLLYSIVCASSAFALDCPYPSNTFSCNSTFSLPLIYQEYRADIEACNADLVGNFQEGFWVALEGNGNTWLIAVSDASETDDPQINAFTCSGGNLSCAAASNSNEDLGDYSESVALNTIDGEYYYIFLNSPSAELGSFLSTTAWDMDLCPSNSVCERSRIIPCGETVTGNTALVNLSEAPDDACLVAGDGGGEGLWFEVIGTGREMTATITSSDFDTQLALYRGECGSLICRAGVDIPGVGAEESISFTTTYASNYFLYVDGWNAQEGEFELQVDCDPGCPESIELVCNGGWTAPLSGDLPYRADLVSCASGIHVDGPGFWANFSGLAETTYVGISANNFDAHATIYTCLGNTLNCLTAVNSNEFELPFDEVISLPASLGTDYYLFVSSNDPNDIGEYFTARIWGETECPINARCFAAQEISCGQTVSGDISNASTFDPVIGCNLAADGNNPGLFYEFYGDGNDIEVQIKNANFDIQLAIYSYIADCDELTCIDGVDVPGVGAVESITVNTSLGTRYLAYVDGSNNSIGEFELELNCVQACPVAINLSCNQSLSAPYVLLPERSDVISCDPEVEVDGPGYWVNFTGTGGTQQIGLRDLNDNDPQLTVYRCVGNSLICYDAFDDNEGLNYYDSEFANLTTVEGEEYYILITYNDPLAFVPGQNCGIAIYSDEECPANQLCQLSKRIQCGETVSGSTFDVLAGAPDPCVVAADGSTYTGLYYSVIGDGNDLTATISNSDFDTQLSVYQGACGSLICIDGADIPGTGFGESITFSTISAREYTIYVDGWGNLTGDFDLSIDCPDPCPNPNYTLFCNGSLTAPLVDLPLIPTATSCAAGVEADGKGVWMSVMGTGEELTVALSSQDDLDLQMNVYACSGAGLSCVVGFDDDLFLNAWNQELMTFTTLNGQEYLLLITADNETDTANPSISARAFFEGSCPINSECATALPLYCDESVIGDISSTGAATNSPVSCDGGADGIQSGLWYRWRGNGENVRAKILSAGTNFDTQIAVYQGTNCDNFNAMTCVGGADIVSDTGGEEVAFSSLQGVFYSIYVDGWSDEQGVFQLLLECNPGVDVDIRILLEGPYISGGLMNADLGALIPLSASGVYGGAPYNYLGAESVAAIPADMVDWVLVEARTGTPNPSNSVRGTTTVQTLAGILLSNGQITDTNGGPLRFSINSGTPHYFAVRHRNHLDVLSSGSFTGSSYTLNFRTSVGAAFGIEQLKPSSDGHVFMHSGDYNQDHVIQTTDFDLWQNDPAILNQYELADGNLDGVVQTTDFDEWNKNKAKIGSIEVSY